MTDYLGSIKVLSERLGLSPADPPLPESSDDVFTTSSDVVIKVTAADPTTSTSSDDGLKEGTRVLMMKRGAKRSVTSTRSLPSTSTPDVMETQTTKRLSNVKALMDILNVEMMALRRMDQDLAKQFLKIYSDIQDLKVQKCCLQYEDLLDEAKYETEMADEVPDLCDAPAKWKNKMLSSLGVTRMNINARRFSCS